MIYYKQLNNFNQLVAVGICNDEAKLPPLFKPINYGEYQALYKIMTFEVIEPPVDEEENKQEENKDASIQD